MVRNRAILFASHPKLLYDEGEDGRCDIVSFKGAFMK